MARIEHPVSKDVLCAIGHAVVSFSILESSLQMLAIGLIGLPQRLGRAATVELSFRSLRALVMSLLLERTEDSEVAESFRSVLGDAARCEDERNRILHSTWGVDESKPRHVYRSKETAKERHGLQGASEELMAPDLVAIGDSFLDVASAVERLLETMVAKRLIENPYGPLVVVTRND